MTTSRSWRHQLILRPYQTKLGEGAKQMFFDGVGFKTKSPGNKAEILSKMREAVKQNRKSAISNQFPAKTGEYCEKCPFGV